MNQKYALMIGCCFLLLFCLCRCSNSPFIESDEIFQVTNQFQINLIMNQNRNVPIIIVTVSHNKSKQTIKEIIKNAFIQQPGICFALVIDCNNLNLDLNGTLGFCKNYVKTTKKQETDNDPYFRFTFLVPSSLRIIEKGHLILKNHDIKQISEQNLDSAYISKMIRQQLPDFVTTIEDSYDLEEFIDISSNTRKSRQPKIILFDSNLLSPLYLRKLAAKLDREVGIAVCDDQQIAKKYKTTMDSIVMFQYNFESNTYQTTVLKIDDENPYLSIKNQLSQYLSIGKSRDILLDFQHKDPKIYNFSNTKSINYLLSHGRIILTQLSTDPNTYSCNDLMSQSTKYSTLFNYVCFSRKNIQELASIIKKDKKIFDEVNILFVDQSLSKSKLIRSPYPSLYSLLPRIESRQLISNQNELDLCQRTAKTTGRDAIYFYFQNSQIQEIQIIQYLNSLEDVNQLIFFCKISSPNQQLIDKFKRNSIFYLHPTNQEGHLQKIQQGNVKGFQSIKTFVREICSLRMNKIYSQRLNKNKIQKVDSPEKLTELCFANKCIIALIATGKYRVEKQLQIFKTMSLKQGDENYKFIWIDGICHFQIAKQLKILKKKQKMIDRSYVFMYREKDASYILWKSNKTWDEKELNKWIKKVKKQQTQQQLKYGIDIEDKVCQKIPIKIQKEEQQF